MLFLRGRENQIHDRCVRTNPPTPWDCRAVCTQRKSKERFREWSLECSNESLKRVEHWTPKNQSIKSINSSEVEVLLQEVNAKPAAIFSRPWKMCSLLRERSATSCSSSIYAIGRVCPRCRCLKIAWSITKYRMPWFPINIIAWPRLIQTYKRLPCWLWMPLEWIFLMESSVCLSPLNSSNIPATESEKIWKSYQPTLLSQVTMCSILTSILPDLSPF